jgi:hypothetical protein
MQNLPFPTVADLDRAHKVYEKREPRALLYWEANELVELGIAQRNDRQIVNGVALLLKTWNQTYYRFQGGFGQSDFNEIDRLVSSHKEMWARLRPSSLTESDFDIVTVQELFANFRNSLGPVGGVKSLHLLAPQYLALWDGPIADNYGFALNAQGYLNFLTIAKEQCQRLCGAQILDRNMLKGLDEYNYCRAKGWDF